MGTTIVVNERATVYEGAQVAVETTAGVIVAANRRLLGCEFMLDAETNVTQFRPQGSKGNTTEFQGKEMSMGKLRAHMCFNDVPYYVGTWLDAPSAPLTPANNGVFSFTGATGTFGFTYKGSVLAPASWANAAALQTAIAALASVGLGNVVVTSSGSGQYTVQFVAGLSTDDSAITSITGTPLATMAAVVTPTLTRRWVFTLQNWGPDNINTLSLEKGARGITGYGKRAGFMMAKGLSFKFNKNECSVDGDMMGQFMQDAFTLTTSGVTDVPLVPSAPKSTSVFIGDALNDPIVGLTRLTRALELDFGATNKAGGIITLNDQDPSFSGRVETIPALTSRLTVEEDTKGISLLAKLRAGTPQVVVCENIGPQIETGYNYRFKAVMTLGLMKPNEQDSDGVVARAYDAELQYNSTLGTALQITVDCIMASL